MTPEPETFWFLNNHVTIGVAKDDTPDGVSVLKLRLPVDEAPPLHIHHDEDEIFHIVRGEVRFKVGDAVRIAHPGDTILAPRGIPHGFRVLSRDGAEFLTITHGGFERMVRDMARPPGGDTLPEATHPSAEAQKRLADRCRECGIDLLGPPID